MNKLLIYALSLLLMSSTLVFSQDYIPSAILQLDEKFNHHTIIVEKNTHSLFLYNYDGTQFPKLIKEFKVATGKIIGNKEIQGDKKTPEGVYTFKRFHSSNELIEKYGKTGLIYGAGAFTMSYPNVIDYREKKTGGGIWLHSTDDDLRINKGLDSRGCVVAMNDNLKEISKYIQLGNTSTVIVQDLNFLSKKNWLKKKNYIMKTVRTWMSAWQNKDFEAYINSYSKEEFLSSKGNFYGYRKYKRAVFTRADRPVINFNHISILKSKDYAVVTFEQDYSSRVINDIGKKVLYLKQNKNYEWKIVAEEFKKLKGESHLKKFVPAQRFFTSANMSKDFTRNDNDSKSI